LSFVGGYCTILSSSYHLARLIKKIFIFYIHK
jgi:hypothetical protein